MTLIADGLLIAAALTAALYCHVLSRRLRRLRDMDGGVGAAIATLSDQVDALRGALAAARSQSAAATRTMAETTARAEAAAARLELLIAAARGRPAPETPMQRAVSGRRPSSSEGFTPTEVAEMLGLAPGTVRMRLMRARKKIKHTMEGSDEG